ncbi:hypothetical protein ThvES_00010610 [Thiovulum sp. ES]|nr:hypothetical protein ThvES_00010610 [Thiovulum sp. ES]
MLSELFIIILGIIIILLIIYIYIREQDFNRKFKILATKSDSMSRQLHIINKNFSKELAKHKEEISVEVGNYVDAELEQKTLGYGEDVEAVKDAIDKLMVEVNSLKDIDKRVHLLESGMKSAVLERNSSVDNSQKILTFSKQGYSVDDIVRETNISKREVEFALKMAKKSETEES